MRKKVTATVRATGTVRRKEKVVAIAMATHRVTEKGGGHCHAHGHTHGQEKGPGPS